MTNLDAFEAERAYQDGRLDGRVDRQLEQQSRYAWLGIFETNKNSYRFHYSRGYRAGWKEQQQ